MHAEEHTSELQSHSDLVCRLLLEKKNHTRSDSLVFNIQQFTKENCRFQSVSPGIVSRCSSDTPSRSHNRSRALASAAAFVPSNRSGNELTAANHKALD